jgi:hypothetical protein
VVDNLTLARQNEATLKADLEREPMEFKRKKEDPCPGRSLGKVLVMGTGEQEIMER